MAIRKVESKDMNSLIKKFMIAGATVSLASVVPGGAAFATVSDPCELYPDQPGCGGGDVMQIIMNIISWVLGILSLVAVIVIIYGGVRYMTSAGDSGKVKDAKNTILYGIIGLVIALLAFAIVSFVIGGINTATN